MHKNRLSGHNNLLHENFFYPVPVHAQSPVLSELASEDEAKETKFYETLKQYLLVGNNVSMAAKKMFIHRNTMIYRLSKINEILGVDINEPGIAHKILISILLREQEKEEK